MVPRDLEHVFFCDSETGALWLFEYITPSSHVREEIKMGSASGEVKLRWDLSTDDILKKTEELIERSKKVYDAIGALKPHQLTFDNCLKVLLLCLKNWFSPCIHTLCSRVCMCKSFNVICQAACTVQGTSAFIILFDHSSESNSKNYTRRINNYPLALTTHADTGFLPAC